MQRRAVKIVLILVLICSVIFFGCSKKKDAGAGTEVKKIPVAAESVKKGKLEKTILLGGLLQPCEEVFLAAKLPSYRILSVPVRVGDPVSAGTPLAVLDSRELDLQLEQARLNYERNKQLYEAGAVSKYQLEQLKIALDNLELQKENTVITSPIKGLVSSVAAVEGQLAGATPLVSVANIDKLKLLVQVGEANIAKLEQGARMAVRVPAVPGKEYAGVITSIAPRIDAVTKAYPVTLEVVNENGAIKGGMYGEVELVIDSKEDTIVIPQYALLDYEQKKIVYVVENETAKMREVQVGLTLGDKAEIIKGLAEGDLLIVEGQYGVKDGSAVSVTARGEKK